MFASAPSWLVQWWSHLYLEILVPPVGSGGKSQLGFSTLRYNNFLPKAVINVHFSKETWYGNVVCKYFFCKPENSLQRLKNCSKGILQEFYIGNFLDSWIDLHHLIFIDLFSSNSSQFLNI